MYEKEKKRKERQHTHTPPSVLSLLIVVILLYSFWGAAFREVHFVASVDKDSLFCLSLFIFIFMLGG